MSFAFQVQSLGSPGDFGVVLRIKSLEVCIGKR